MSNIGADKRVRQLEEPSKVYKIATEFYDASMPLYPH
jgi:hypothetical protein